MFNITVQKYEILHVTQLRIHIALVLCCFALMPLGWLCSTTLTPTYAIISYGISFFIYTHFFRNTTRA
jgi:hypothetical protein